MREMEQALLIHDERRGWLLLAEGVDATMGERIRVHRAYEPIPRGRFGLAGSQALKSAVR